MYDWMIFMTILVIYIFCIFNQVDIDSNLFYSVSVSTCRALNSRLPRLWCHSLRSPPLMISITVGVSGAPRHKSCCTICIFYSDLFFLHEKGRQTNCNNLSSTFGMVKLPLSILLDYFTWQWPQINEAFLTI